MKGIEKNETVILEKNEKRGLSYTRLPIRRGYKYNLSSRYHKVLLANGHLIMQHKPLGAYSTLFSLHLTKDSYLDSSSDMYINLEKSDYRFTFFEEANRLALDIDIYSEPKYNLKYSITFNDLTAQQVAELKKYYYIYPSPDSP